MLDAREVSVAFGGVRAVNAVSLQVATGGFLGLVGPNGSGKTTFLNALTGVVPATGQVMVNGRRVRLGSPRSARRAGILRVFQAPQVIAPLTCLENVTLASPSLSATGLAAATVGRPWMLRNERARWQHAADALAEVGLAGDMHRPAGGLTYGQRRLLDLARALNGSPWVLLLDEPSAGLNDSETAEFIAILERLDRADMCIVLVEHKVDVIDRLCDQVAVLELGEVIATAPPNEVWRDERVANAYLGVRGGA
jgi:ABC-type branched-subunit amino acid transport system ATPase component